ncbi:MAG: cytochrome C [Filomicrobium sp.]
MRSKSKSVQIFQDTRHWSATRASAYHLFRMATYAFAVSMVWTAAAQADGLGYDNLPPQELCGLCHGLNGISATAKFPKLAGQKPAYIEKQLKDFLSGKRTNDGGQMESIVTEIAPEQFKDVAAYFSEREPPTPPESDAPDLTPDERTRAHDLFNKGRAEAGIPACASCHIETNDDAKHAPYLTSQHRDYLAKQLNDFRNGMRDNDTTGTMQKIAAALEPDEIEILAGYLAATPRAGSEK